MPDQSSDELPAVLKDIRNWVRAAAYPSVKAMLQGALPDAKSRIAYQMFDGTVSGEQVRAKCRMSPNAVVALTTRCVAMGLMEVNADKKRTRLFDLNDFGLMPTADPEAESKRER